MYGFTGFSFGADNDGLSSSGFFQNENYTLAAVCERRKGGISEKSADKALEILRGCIEGESHLGTLKNAEYPEDGLNDIVSGIMTEWKKQVGISDVFEFCTVGAVFESGGKLYAFSLGNENVMLIKNDGLRRKAFENGIGKDQILTKALSDINGAIITSEKLAEVLSEIGKTDEFYNLTLNAIEDKTTKEAKEVVSDYIKGLPCSDEKCNGAVIFRT